MNRYRNKLFFISTSILLTLFLLSGCSNTKYLADGEQLYVKGKVEITELGKVKDTKEMKSILEDLIYPEPNKKFLGFIRLRLWLYNIIGNTDNKNGLRDFLKNQYGEDPVVLSEVNPQDVETVMLNRLFNNGHFKADVYSEIKTKKNKKKVKVIYKASIHQAYTIDTIIYPHSNDPVDTLIAYFKENTVLKQGQRYQLENMQKEQERISNMMREIGYYYFNPDMLIFLADSTLGERKVRLELKVSEDAPKSLLKPYFINNVFLNVSDASHPEFDDGYYLDSIYYSGLKNMFDPEFMVNSVFIRPNRKYSVKGEQQTLDRLSSLGVFKFTGIKFSSIDSTSSSLLDVDISLTPMDKRTAKAAITTSVKSTNFVGPSIEMSLVNRNLFGEAENLSIGLFGGVETQFKGRDPGNMGKLTYNVGVNSELTFHRFISPFNFNRNINKFLPETKIAASFTRNKRIRFYAMNQFNTSFGYSWKETQNKMHNLKLVDVSYQFLGKTTSKFDSIIQQNSLLARSYENQFIIGTNYKYVFFTPNEKNTKNTFRYQGDVDISGNVLNLLQSTFGGVKPNGSRTFLNVKYAQYLRFGSEITYKYVVDKRNALATRVLAGVGIPVGNSEVLPLIKQYFAGGTNDLRAFQARAIGPGAFNPKYQEGVFVDQSGDIKLEANLEYRFRIFKSIEGATFIDAGNIWLYNQDTDRPNGAFDFNTFQQQVAIGTGLGVRYITNFIVIRLDYGFPLRIPFIVGNNKWVWQGSNFKDYDFGGVINFGIGYPF